MWLRWCLCSAQPGVAPQCPSAHSTSALLRVNPNKGKAIDVTVDTHISGSIEFCQRRHRDADREFRRLEFATAPSRNLRHEGHLLNQEHRSVDGPNLSEAQFSFATSTTIGGKDCRVANPIRTGAKFPVTHRFNDLCHRKNSRGIGLVDMAYALVGEREARANGAMALHCLEVMEGVLISVAERRFFDFESRRERPAPLPVNFPDSERAR